MQLDKLCVACFSPTHTSMKIARAIADGTHIARREEIDLTTDPADTMLLISPMEMLWLNSSQYKCCPPSTGDLWPR